MVKRGWWFKKKKYNPFPNYAFLNIYLCNWTALSVRPSVRNVVFSLHFLIFCLKLAFDKHLKVTESIAWGIYLIFQKMR